jgi:hypothetical protein
LAEVHLVWRHEANTSVVMVFVVPGEEASAEGASLMDGFKVLGKFRLIFQGLEMGFRERIIVRGMNRPLFAGGSKVSKDGAYGKK